MGVDRVDLRLSFAARTHECDLEPVWAPAWLAVFFSAGEGAPTALVEIDDPQLTLVVILGTDLLDAKHDALTGGGDLRIKEQLEPQ